MLQKSSIEQTLGVFFRSPTKEFTLKDASRDSKLAHTSTKQNLSTLIRLGLIQRRIEKKGERKFPLYKASKSTLFVQYKRIYNLIALLETGIITSLEHTLMPKCIILFGSYQRGEDTEESDIDLFIEGKKKAIDVRQSEKKLRRKIELHFHEHFTTYSPELKNNIINGVVLYGFLEGYM